MRRRGHNNRDARAFKLKFMEYKLLAPAPVAPMHRRCRPPHIDLEDRCLKCLVRQLKGLRHLTRTSRVLTNLVSEEAGFINKRVRRAFSLEGVGAHRSSKGTRGQQRSAPTR